MLGAYGRGCLEEAELHRHAARPRGGWRARGGDGELGSAGAARRRVARGRAAPGSRAKSVLEHLEHRAACRARRPGGRAGRAVTAVPPSVTSCSSPCTRVIPSGLPERSFVAKFPSVATTLRPDQLDLPEEVRLAGLDLVRLRVAVPGRPALEDVRDVDVVARQADPVEQLVEQLARPAPTNGTPCWSSWKPGRLADEHQVGVGIAEPNTTCVRPCGERGSACSRHALGGVARRASRRAVRRQCRSHSFRRSSRRRHCRRSSAAAAVP